MSMGWAQKSKKRVTFKIGCWTLMVIINNVLCIDGKVWRAQQDLYIRKFDAQRVANIDFVSEPTFCMPLSIECQRQPNI